MCHEAAATAPKGKAGLVSWRTLCVIGKSRPLKDKYDTTALTQGGGGVPPVCSDDDEAGGGAGAAGGEGGEGEEGEENEEARAARLAAHDSAVDCETEMRHRKLFEEPLTDGSRPPIPPLVDTASFTQQLLAQTPLTYLQHPAEGWNELRVSLEEMQEHARECGLSDGPASDVLVFRGVRFVGPKVGGCSISNIEVGGRGRWVGEWVSWWVRWAGGRVGGWVVGGR
jgi:hypothetical protein